MEKSAPEGPVQQRAAPSARNAALSDAAAPVLSGAASSLLQRTLGNRALARRAALQQRAPSNLIQRGFGDGDNTKQLLLADRPWDEIEQEEAKTGQRAKPKQPPPMLADRPWDEIEQEEAKTGQRAKPKQPLLLADRPWAQIEEEQQLKARLNHNPLMLTDRPWSEIAKEKDPATKLFRGDNKDVWGRDKKEESPVQVEMDAPTQQPGRAPLRLTDRPWEEAEPIEAEDAKAVVTLLNKRLNKLYAGRNAQTFSKQLGEYHTKYLTNAKARAKLKSKATRRVAIDEIAQLEQMFAAAEEAEQKRLRKAKRVADKKNARSSAVSSFKGSVDEARQQPGGTQYQAELAEIDKKYTTAGQTRFAQGSPGWQSASESDLFWVRAKHAQGIKRNKALQELRSRVALLTNGAGPLHEAHSIARNDGAATVRKTYLGPLAPERVDQELKLANLKARIDQIAARIGALNQLIDAIERDTTDSKAVNDANSDLAATDDQPLLNFGGMVQEMRASHNLMLSSGVLHTARLALLPPFQNVPHLMNATLYNWLQGKVSEKPHLDRTGYLAEVQSKLQLQYLITGSYWLRNILNFNFVVRPGQPTLYILDCGTITLNNKGHGTTNYNVHLSVFADTITDARITCIDTAANIVDSLIVSNTDNMKAAHVTLELYPHGGWPTTSNPNPHYYRGGGNDEKKLSWKTNDTWATVMPLLQGKLTTAIANFQAPVQTVVTNKGDAGFPLPGSLV